MKSQTFLSKWKVFSYMDRLTSICETGSCHPVTLEIDPINACNHKCKFCSDAKFKRNADRLDPDFVESLLIQVQDYGVKGVIFKGGGEPTLHSSLSIFLQWSKELGFDTGILTNGSKITPYLAYAIAKNCAYVRVSLDAYDRESHKAWHGTDDWDIVIKGISALVDAKQSHGSDVMIGVNVLYDPETYSKITGVVALMQKIGIDILSFRFAYTKPHGHKVPWKPEDVERCRAAMEAQRAALPNTGNMQIMWDASRGEEVSGIPGTCLEDSLPKCLATSLIAIVCADGKLYPCCDLRYQEDYCFGDLKTSSFAELWEGDRRKEILNNLVIPKACYKWCTNRTQIYNDLLCYLTGDDKPHVGLV